MGGIRSMKAGGSFEQEVVICYQQAALGSLIPDIASRASIATREAGHLQRRRKRPPYNFERSIRLTNRHSLTNSSNPLY